MEEPGDSRGRWVQCVAHEGALAFQKVFSRVGG